MSEIVLNLFGGLNPRIGEHLLNNNMSLIAENCTLRSGEIRGLSAPVKLQTVSTPSGIQRTFRIEGSSGDIFVSFTNFDTDFVKGPLINDAFDRYYWTDDTDEPQYNTLARIESASASYRLGVSKPDNAASLAVTGGSGVSVTRAYVYTFVSDFGEEGPPSDPVVVSGFENGSWDLTSLDTTDAFGGERTITNKRIYRTITDTGGNADYYFVTEVTMATTNYSDTSNTDDIALNDILLSADWFEPPTTLRGLKAHPNGFLVGFTGRDIYMSEPYRPHAWPSAYVVSTEFDIVNIEIAGTQIVVATEGNPYVIDGSHPATTTFTKLRKSEPCQSKYGVVSIAGGVAYPSHNGLMYIENGVLTNITRGLFTRNEWQAKYNLTTLMASEDDGQYIAFDSTTTGFIFDPTEPNNALVDLNSSIFNTEMIQSDPRTGQVLIINNNVIYQWNPANGIPMEYRWRSKPFKLPRPVNFGAYQVTYSTDLTVTEESLDEQDDYNALRFAVGPLDTLNKEALGAAGDTLVAGSILQPRKYPVGGSPLFNTNYYRQLVPNITFNIYINNEITPIHMNTISDEDMWRIESGYKSDEYSFEFISNANIQIFKIAETGKGLARV